jgi:hypothetical protein
VVLPLTPRPPDLPCCPPPHQEVLQAGLVRLALDHPHHTCFHLIALRNGVLGASGKAHAAGSMDATGVHVQVVDQEKVGGSCCAVLCCAVLCCAVLCCAVLCCAVHVQHQ